ncbi:MAG: hypothetical protein HY513_03790 [Candidatus Aenigmarchaeota archaeon]|nr:hypothetical protein [Candidatus Aenigmarchaeota archaeon]
MTTKTITVSVDKETEEKFRKLASATYGNQKGYLGKALTDAMKEWEKKKEESDAVAKMLKLMEKGIKMKKWEFNRNEIYAARFEKRK